MEGSGSFKLLRILEAQKHTDPDPEHRLKGPVAAHVFNDDPLLNRYQMRCWSQRSI